MSDGTLAFGSPTTKGRDNAGYGGLFWRGPRSFTGGLLVAPTGAGGDELRGSRAEWFAFQGRHDETGAHSTVVIVDDRDNPRHPPQWFARTEEFACLKTNLPLLPESVRLWFVALMESKREGLSFDEAMARLEGSWPEQGYLEWRRAIGQPATPPDA